MNGVPRSRNWAVAIAALVALLACVQLGCPGASPTTPSPIAVVDSPPTLEPPSVAPLAPAVEAQVAPSEPLAELKTNDEPATPTDNAPALLELEDPPGPKTKNLPRSTPTMASI